jgi:hypothetical protein
MGSGRRKYIRHPLSYPVKTRIIKSGTGSEEKDVAGKTDNIGPGGVLFTSKDSIPVKFEVEIEVVVEKRKFLMDGRVVRCRRTDDGRYCIAVAFNTSNELLKARMMEQVVRIKAFKDRLEKRYHVSLDFAEVAKEWIKRYSEYFADRYNFDE